MENLEKEERKFKVTGIKNWTKSRRVLMKNNSKGFELGKTTELREHKSYKQKIKKKKKRKLENILHVHPFL